MQMVNQDKIYGGSYQKYIDLINELLIRNNTIYHISPKNFNNIKNNNLLHYDIRYISFIPRYLTFSLQTLFMMLKITRKNKIDSIITFSPIECILPIIIRPFIKKTKIIIQIHGDAISGIEVNVKNKYKKHIYVFILKIIEKIVVKYADLIIFVSEYDRKRVLERTSINCMAKTKVIYNNINTARVLSLSVEPAYSFGNDLKVIGFVGSLYEEGKGLKYLLESFVKIKTSIPNTLLVLIGTGPDLLKLKQLSTSLGIEKSVIFLGQKENPLKYMKGFNLMVLPSLHEACPLVILESLYVGTPIVGSNVGGIPELLKYDDLLFAPANVDDLTKKLYDILSNENYYNQIKNECSDRKKYFEFDWGQEMTNALR